MDEELGSGYLEPPEPARSGPFAYDGTGIKLDGIPRAPVHELRQIFQKDSTGRPTKKWLIAQLQFHGLRVRKSDRVAALKDQLEHAFRSGKCNVVNPSMKELETSLSEQYRQRFTAYAEKRDRLRDRIFDQQTSPSAEARYDSRRFLAKYFLDGLDGKPCPEKTPLVLEDSVDWLRSIAETIPGLVVRNNYKANITVIGWRDNFEAGLDEAFARLSAPDARPPVLAREANFDLRRFLAKYFLDGLDGKPAPQKTPDPIEIEWFWEPAGLDNAVLRIPGLRICCALSEYRYTKIIGWDLGKVQLRKHEIEQVRAKAEAEAYAEIEAAERARREESWQRALRRHHQYLQNYQPPHGPLDLGRLSGQYLVESQQMYCDDYKEEGDYYEDEARDDTAQQILHIHPPSERSSHGVMAAFEFGLVRGTMLLAMSEDAVHQLEQDVDRRSDCDVREYEDEDDDDCVDTILDPHGSRKRKATADRPSISIKRRLGEAPRPNRVYMKWRGRTTVENVIDMHNNEEDVGHLDFDETTASARGEFACPSYHPDGPVRLAIHKVSDRPIREPEPWGHLSDMQYEYERVARWR